VSAFLSTPERADSIEDFQQNIPINEILCINDSARHYQPFDIEEPLRPKTRDGFDVATICVLPLEADAVLSAFDHHWDKDLYDKASNNPNFYSLGGIGRRNVV
jgi:hypothetical protein